MAELVQYSTQDNVAILAVNNPPVNALSTGVPEGIEEGIHRAEADASVNAIVLIGGGRTFIAGADINDFLKVVAGEASLPDLQSVLVRVEDSKKPLVAAIHGSALGGGLEVAMGCHYRVATADAQIGQPETKLGIIPGAAGTQRLPRLVGILKAAELCALGDPVTAPVALTLGILDHVVEGDLLAGAVAFAKSIVNQPLRKTRDCADKLSAVDLTELRAQVKKVRRNQIAPLAAIDSVEGAATLSFAEGCKRELEIFDTCLYSVQAKSLIHAFFGERAVAKIPGLSKDAKLYPIKSAAVIGAGTMGGGISMCFANSGIPVRMTDTTQAAVDRGMATIRKNYENSVKRGRFTQEVMDQRMALIQPQLGYGGFETADVIVEAVFESMALKKEIFAALDKIAKPDCVLASNTSTLDIDQIAGATSRPDMVIGLHFFSPANVMRLVEVVRGKATSDAVIATSMALTKTLKKVGVLVRNGFGFVGNRMMFPYMFEAQFLVEEGATPEQVDRALTDWGMAMGIFSVDDMAGIDVMQRVLQEFPELGAGGRQPLVASQLYQMGRYGQKTGKGWYKYDESRKQSPDAEVIDLIRKTAADAGIPQRTFTAEEIVERTVYGLINEGARILEEGVALRPVDIDVIYLSGYGFPAYRGGPMFYADTVGLKKIYDRVCEFEKEHGSRWTPAPLLKRLAAEGKTFAD